MEQTTNHGTSTSQNKQLIQRKIIEGSPFYVVKQIMDNNKEQYFMIMGDYRLTEPTETEKETLDKLITEHWNIIVNIIAIACDKMLQQKIIDEAEQLKSNVTPYETESL